MLDFSSIPDDILLEIFAYLPAQDVLRSRLVCRRIFAVTNERFVWDHVFWRTNAPLSYDIHPFRTPVAGLEKALGRAERMDKIWSGKHIPVPRVVQHTKAFDSDIECRGTMNPYVIFATTGATHGGERSRYIWYDPGSPQKPVFEYRAPKRLVHGQTHCFDIVDENLAYVMCISWVVRSKAAESPHQLEMVAIRRRHARTGPKFTCATERFVPLLWQPMTYTEFRMENGYVILSQADAIDGAVPTRLQLFHIATGRWIVAAIYEDFVLQLEENPNCVFGRVHLKISQSHMIQILDGKHMAFFKLPDHNTPVTGTPYILSEAPTHITSFPGPLYDLTVLPQPGLKFGLMAMEPDKEKPVVKRLRLLTFDLSGPGPEPAVSELDSMNIGTRHCRLQTIVMSRCSLFSNTFLGVTVMGAEVPERLAPSADSVHQDHRQLFLVAVRINLTDKLQADGSDDARWEPNIRLTVLDLPEEIVSSCKAAYLFHFDYQSGMLAVEARMHEGSEARSIVCQYLWS